MFSGSSRDVSSSSVGHDFGLLKKPSRHVSIQIPTVDDVVPRKDLSRSRKSSPASASHHHSGNTGRISASTASLQSKCSTGVDGRRGELPEKSARSQSKNSKLTPKAMRFEKQKQKSLEASDCILDKSSSSAAVSADNRIFSKASGKTSAAIFSGSDIKRILESKIKSGTISKDLAQLILSLSTAGPELLPLSKTKISELHRWISAADSCFSHLPPIVQNHLKYMLQIRDGECSAAKRSKDCKLGNVDSHRNSQATSQLCDVSNNTGRPSNVMVSKAKLQSKLSRVNGQRHQIDSGCSASGRPLGKWDQTSAKNQATGSRNGSFLTNKTRQQVVDSDDDEIRYYASRKSSGYSVRSAASDENDNAFHMDMSSLASCRKDQAALRHFMETTISRQRKSLASSRNQEQMLNSRRSTAKQSSSSKDDATSSLSFSEKAQDVIKKIGRTLPARHMLRNSSKSPSLRYSTSKHLRMTDEKRSSVNTAPHELHHSASSSTIGDDAGTSCDMLELLKDHSFSVKSHLQKVAQKNARKPLGSEFHNSVQSRSSLDTRKSLNSSLRSQDSSTRHPVALPKKATSLLASGKSSSNTRSSKCTRAQGPVTSSKFQVVDIRSCSSAAHHSSTFIASKTQQDLTCGKVRKDANKISSFDISPNKCNRSALQNNAFFVAETPCNASKKAATSSKGTNQSRKLPSAPSVSRTKPRGRWSDLGSWNGKVYTITRVTSSSDMPAPKSSSGKQSKKKAQLTVGSHGRNKVINEYQKASDKSSAETVISCASSKPSLNTEHSTSVSTVDEPSPDFKVHSRKDRSQTKNIPLKRQEKKPTRRELTSKGGISSCRTRGERKASQKLTASAASRRDRQKTSSRTTSEMQCLPSAVKETTQSVTKEETCSVTKKKSPKERTGQRRIVSLSDTNTAISNETFVSDNLRHFGKPPRAWVGSWSLSTANGSRSSLDVMTDKEDNCSDDDTGTLLTGPDDRCIISGLKVSSYDSSVSTDSEPGLSASALQTEVCERDGQESDNNDDTQPPQPVDAVIPSESQLHCTDPSHIDHHSDDSSISDAMSNPDFEDIQLEPFPSGLFCLSYTDVSMPDMVPDRGDHESDECRKSLSFGKTGALRDDFASLENKQNAEKANAEDVKVAQHQCRTAKSGCELCPTDSGNHLNENVNNLPSSNSSPLSSDLQPSDSSKDQSFECCDIVRVSSNNSVDVKGDSSEFSDDCSSRSLSQSNVTGRSRLPQHSLAACASSQLGKSLPVIVVDANEKFRQKDLERNANSRDSLLIESLGRDSNYDIKMTADAPVLKSVDDVSGRVMKLNSRQCTSKFKKDLGRFVNKATLANIPCSLAKRDFETNGRQRNLAMSDGQIALKCCHSDTDYKILSNSTTGISLKALNKQVKNVIVERQKKSAKPTGQELSDTEIGYSSVTTDSSSGIDHKSLKGVAQKSVSDDSSDDLGRSATAKVEHLMSGSSDNDTRPGNVPSSTASCQSTKERMENTNSSLDQDENKSELKLELSDGCGVNSSSCVSEPDTSTVGSLADDSTGHNTTTSSDKIAACDSPSSSDNTCAPSGSSSVSSIDYPQCASTSSAMSSERADPTTDCAEMRRKDLDLDSQECMSNVDLLAKGADTCFDESDACKLGFDEVERRPVLQHKECPESFCSVFECPAKSERFSSHIPSTGNQTRQSASVTCQHDERSPRLISTSRHRTMSDTRANADENRRYKPCGAYVATTPENDGRCSDDFSTDIDCPCDVITRPWRPSLTDVRTHKYSVKVNCRSSYRMKLRGQSKRNRCYMPVKCSAGETGSSETDPNDDSCSLYSSPREDIDDILSMNVCPKVKRISCSQLYRLSRAVTLHSPTVDCNTDNCVCNISASFADFCNRETNTPAAVAAVNSGNKSSSGIKLPHQDDRANQDVGSSKRSASDVCNDKILPFSENPDSAGYLAAPAVSQVSDRIEPKEPEVEDQTDLKLPVDDKILPSSENPDSAGYPAAPAVSQVSDRIEPKEPEVEDQTDLKPPVDSPDVVLPQEIEDAVDISSTAPLLLQKKTASDVPEIHSQEPSRDNVCGTELNTSDIKMRVEAEREAGAENSNVRPTTPYSDCTASSASTSFSLPASGELSDTFLEVLSSRLLVAMEQKQQQSQSCGFERPDIGNVETATGKHARRVSGAREVGGYPAPSLSECMNAAVNSRAVGTQRNIQCGLADCCDYERSACLGGSRRMPGVEGYLQRCEPAADYNEWMMHPAGVKPGLTGLRTADNSATTADCYEVLLLNLLLSYNEIHAFKFNGLYYIIDVMLFFLSYPYELHKVQTRVNTLYIELHVQPVAEKFLWSVATGLAIE